MTREELVRNQAAINAELSKVTAPEVIVDVQNKLQSLCVYTALAAECTKEAKLAYLNQQQEVIRGLSIHELQLSATTLNRLIDSKCATQSADLLYSERLNSALAHSIDGLRSIVSLYKTEMAASMVSQNVS